MKIAIGQAYNSIHKEFRKKLKELKVDSFLFNIDNPNWDIVIAKKPDAYLWLADQKEERYYEVLNRVNFIEKVIKKPIFPDSNMYFAEGNKVTQFEILKNLKVPTPKTYVAFNECKALKIISKIKYPFVLKDPYGYGGHHVFKIKSIAEAKKYINKIFGEGLKVHNSTCKDIFYAQEFLESQKDLRVITIGNKIASAYWREGKIGNWKHNLDQGASVNFKNVPKSALDLSLKISKKLNFHWMGYDFIFDKFDNPKLIEYSCCVRTKGAEIGGYDIRKIQMEYIINYLKIL